MAKPSILPSGMKLVGDVRGDEDFVVFGTVEGEVHVSGSIVVEVSGAVRGNVQGRTVAVRGTVVGDASAEESIRVDSGGHMVGDVRAPRVNIVKGARFRGHVHMTGPRPVLDTRPRRLLIPPTPEVRERREAPTMPGSVRAASKLETVVGGEVEQATVHEREPRRPPVPRMPMLVRARARRRGDDAIPRGPRSEEP